MRTFKLILVAGLAAGALLAVGCGEDESEDAQAVDVTVTEAGQGQFEISGVPAEIDGGLVELTLDNSAGKAPHSGQLVKLNGGHTSEEALEIIAGEESVPIPEWLRAYGGVGETAPGETGTATVDLDEGHYMIVDDAENEAKQPAIFEFDVTGGDEAALPETDASVTAAEADGGPDAYDWEYEGLKAGENEITFNSEGEKALHHLVAFPIKGDATLDEVRSELLGEPEGPPQTIDPENITGTAVLDGGKSEVTTLNLQAGRYVFVCFLPDRDKPEKSHVEEGMFDEVTVAG